MYIIHKKKFARAREKDGAGGRLGFRDGGGDAMLAVKAAAAAVEAQRKK